MQPSSSLELRRTGAVALHAAPAVGEVQKITSGILWVRLCLPYGLDHVNVYLIEDYDGWAVVDTGCDNEETRHLWQHLLAGPLKGIRLTKIIATHGHCDHIGLAGWMCDRFDAPLLASRTTYLDCCAAKLDSKERLQALWESFYARNGLDPQTRDGVIGYDHRSLFLTGDLPANFGRLADGDFLRIGWRQFEVITGDGHAPEQVMLYSGPDQILLSSDHVLPKIIPTIGVSRSDPSENSLRRYITSLNQLRKKIPPGSLILPGHMLPFQDLHSRIDQIIAFHEGKKRTIAEALLRDQRSVADLVKMLYPRALDGNQMSYVFADTLAHLNDLLEADLVQRVQHDSGSILFQTAPR